MAIAQFETLVYNSFPFPVETALEIEATPNFDGAGRVVVSVTHTLTATFLYNVASNETTLPALRAALEVPGQKLTLTGTGYGDLSVNGGGAPATTRTDLAWGPKPRRLHWRPLGVGSCEITWSCDVTLPWCPNGPTSGQLMAYNYSVRSATDAQGYASRTISGYLEIPLTRPIGGGGAVNDGALNYVWEFEPPVPANFRRTTREATESPDRRRADFSFVDEEMADAIYPPDVVECRASHAITSASRTFINFNATIRASYTLRKGVTKLRALTYFLILVFDRLQAMMAAGTRTILPVSLTMEDPDIYGRQAANFAFSYYYVLVDPSSSGLGGSVARTLAETGRKIVPGSGLWHTPPRTINDYATWRRSMDPVFGPGQAGRFQYAQGNDVLLDLCDQATPGTVDPPFFRIALGPGGSNAELQLALRHKVWIKDEAVVKLGRQNDLKVTRFVPDSPSAAVISVVGNGFAPGAGDVLAKLYAGASGEKLVGDIQVLSEPIITATLVFDRICVGGAPAEPALTKVGNSENLILLSSWSNRSQEGNYFGQVAFRVRGWAVYQLTTKPGQAPIYPPRFDLDGKPYASSALQQNDNL